MASVDFFGVNRPRRMQAVMNLLKKMDRRISIIEYKILPGQLSKKIRERTRHMGFVDTKSATRAVKYPRKEREDDTRSEQRNESRKDTW